MRAPLMSAPWLFVVGLFSPGRLPLSAQRVEAPFHNEVAFLEEGWALSAASPNRQREVCLRAQALAACHAWVPFEITAVGRLAGKSHPRFSPVGRSLDQVADLREYLAWDIGYMVNRDSSHGLGGSLQIGGGESGVRIVAKVRRRTWFGSKSTWDAAAGVLTAQQIDVATNGTTQAYGLTAETGFGMRDLLSVVASGDVTRGAGHQAAALHAGVRLGSNASLAGTALAALAVYGLYRSLRSGG